MPLVKKVKGLRRNEVDMKYSSWYQKKKPYNKKGRSFEQPFLL